VRLRSGAAPVAGALGARASLAAGLLLFGGGFLLESVADWQKFVWKSNPGEAEGRPCQRERRRPSVGAWSSSGVGAPVVAARVAAAALRLSAVSVVGHAWQRRRAACAPHCRLRTASCTVTCPPPCSAANQGRFMGPVGLYAYSRYPNYFVSAPPAAAAAVLLSAAPPPLPCLSLPMTGRVGLLSTLSPAAYLRRCCHAAAAAALVLAHLRPW
jgi:hypothetical protein